MPEWNSYEALQDELQRQGCRRLRQIIAQDGFLVELYVTSNFRPLVITSTDKLGYEIFGELTGSMDLNTVYDALREYSLLRSITQSET